MGKTPLPEGWEEFETDDGECYYYHAATKTTQWERPVKGAAPTVPDMDAEKKKAAMQISGPITPTKPTAGLVGLGGAAGSSSTPPGGASAKKKRGLFGLGKKKETQEEKIANKYGGKLRAVGAAADAQAAAAATPSPTAGVDSRFVIDLNESNGDTDDDLSQLVAYYKQYQVEVWLVIYFIINFLLFITKFMDYVENDNVFALLKHGVTIARAAAMCLKFNCALILIPVMRNFMSYLRTTFLEEWVPVDRNLALHKFTAYMIFIFTAAHAFAHYFNFRALSSTPPDKLNRALGLDPPLDETPPIWAWTFLTIPGLTGHLLVVIMILLYSSALINVRKTYFELFWYNHHLFIGFFILLAVHGFPGNLEPPTFWKWGAGPVAMYTLERIVRFIRGFRATTVVEVNWKQGNVMRLCMKRAGFSYKAGQYLFLNCPYLSKHEWHPFTISSSPDEDVVTCHIKIAGDWTRGLQQLLNPAKKATLKIEKSTGPDGSPILRVDGPFGAPSEHVWNYTCLLLVGAGIGVTPFSSILKTILYRFHKYKDTEQFKIRKTYFVWVTRSKGSFEWMEEVLHSLEESLVAVGRSDFLSINIFITGKMTVSDIKQLMSGAKAEQDSVTKLRAKTQFGRPDFDVICSKMAIDHAGETIGVFLCGAKALAKVVKKSCYRHSDFSTTPPTRFEFRKEVF